MRAPIAPAALALFAALVLAGCGRIADCARVAEGNRLYAQGDYQGAIAAYLESARAIPGDPESGKGADSAGGRRPREEAAVLDYDLANVYARLGEYAASSELHAKARRAGAASIAADSSFNEGLAFFEQGRYESAWRSFRSALRLLDPASGEAREARYDLELAWRAWKKSERAAGASGMSPSARSRGSEDEAELRLLRRLETGRWRPGSAPPALPDSADY